eukprot:scaffold3541_cov117-Isochrysis_galbana.AAC.11
MGSVWSGKSITAELYSPQPAAANASTVSPTRLRIQPSSCRISPTTKQANRRGASRPAEAAMMARGGVGQVARVGRVPLEVVVGGTRKQKVHLARGSVHLRLAQPPGIRMQPLGPLPPAAPGGSDALGLQRLRLVLGHLRPRQLHPDVPQPQAAGHDAPNRTPSKRVEHAAPRRTPPFIAELSQHRAEDRGTARAFAAEPLVPNQVGPAPPLRVDAVLVLPPAPAVPPVALARVEHCEGRRPVLQAQPALAAEPVGRRLGLGVQLRLERRLVDEADQSVGRRWERGWVGGGGGGGDGRRQRRHRRAVERRAPEPGLLGEAGCTGWLLGSTGRVLHHGAGQRGLPADVRPAVAAGWMDSRGVRWQRWRLGGRCDGTWMDGRGVRWQRWRLGGRCDGTLGDGRR